MPSVDERVKNKCDVTVLRLFMQNVIFCLRVLYGAVHLVPSLLEGRFISAVVLTACRL